METVRIGGRRYSDPDIISLARQTGELICPRFTIKTQARLLLEELKEFNGLPTDPFERLKILASLKGIKIKPMSIERWRQEKRDAVLYPTDSGSAILYNPNRPRSRTIFTIGHEIIHTLFPNSTSGARFRAMTSPDSREASELERLCDLGAAELVFPLEDFQRLVDRHYSLTKVPLLAEHFGASYEATAYRLATAHPRRASAGLLRYRRRVSEDREIIKISSQQFLFRTNESVSAPAAKKYRRQSLYLSDQCNDSYNIPWNKSFDPGSVVYRAEKDRVVAAIEPLPNSSGKSGRIEAIVAPYQREEADDEFNDVLFFWEEI
jgi:Zn-dependent peptidase ImmA (M78 family)